MRETMLTGFASRETTVHRYLDKYRSWICSKLGCRMEEAVLLELDFPIVQVAASHVLSGIRLRSEDSRPIRELRKLLQSVDLPEIATRRSKCVWLASRAASWQIGEWCWRRGCRMVLRLCGCAVFTSP